MTTLCCHSPPVPHRRQHGQHRNSVARLSKSVFHPFFNIASMNNHSSKRFQQTEQWQEVMEDEEGEEEEEEEEEEGTEQAPAESGRERALARWHHLVATFRTKVSRSLCPASSFAYNWSLTLPKSIESNQWWFIWVDGIFFFFLIFFFEIWKLSVSNKRDVGVGADGADALATFSIHRNTVQVGTVTMETLLN